MKYWEHPFGTNFHLDEMRPSIRPHHIMLVSGPTRLLLNFSLHRQASILAILDSIKLRLLITRLFSMVVGNSSEG